MPKTEREDEDGMAMVSGVREWRTGVLIESGYPQEEAYLLARRLDVDLHMACDLLARGCSVALAIRILT